jgi:hypothetical protein
MGFRFQKRMSLFPGVRLNFSAGGISTTIGVRGANLNIGNRGVHLNLGVPGTGISFRTKLSGNARGNFASTQQSYPSVAEDPQWLEQLGAIKSASTDALTSPGVEGLKRLINEAFARRIDLRKRISRYQSEAESAERKRKIAEWFLIRLFMKRRIPTLALQEEKARAILRQTEHDLESCSIKIDFGFDDAMNAAFSAFIRTFEEARTCTAIWDITTSVAINRVAERTLAANSIARERVQLNFAKSEIIDSHEPPAHFENANGDELFFYPGLLLVKGKSGDFGLIEYADIRVDFRETVFIEEEEVPSDSNVVGSTWKRTNKDGSPDRRFSDNYSIPLVQYGKLQLTSSQGLNEAYLFSAFSKASRFASELSEYQNKLREFSSNETIEPVSLETIDETQAIEETWSDTVSPTRPVPNTFLDWVVLFAIVSGIAGLFFTAPGWLDRAKAFLPKVVDQPPSSVPVQAQQSQRQGSREILYVQKQNVNVRAAPSLDAAIITYGHRGRHVTVFQRQGDWIQIGDDQPVGWMHSSLLSPTPPQ